MNSKAIMHVNIQGGIVSKINELNLILHETNVNIVCLVEHWIHLDQVTILNCLETFCLAAFYCRREGKCGVC